MTLSDDATPVRGRPFAVGNPGRPPGSSNKNTHIVAALRDAAPELLRVLIDKAKAGDMAALKILAPFFMPKHRSIELDAPQLNGSGSAVAALAAVFEAVATGQITPSEGAAVAALVEACTRALNVNELEARLENIENQLNEAA
jgi:hypothetical protein